MSCCESQEQEAFLAERDYVGLVSGDMEVQRKPDRDRGCLAPVCVVNCRDASVCCEHNSRSEASCDFQCPVV
jgi:hypothetical protein